ncbi:M48 family metallopeptidase [Campylobacter blaseri]|nr:SprT family zinc-dependent metalloprotease [Campylobacter blaseri]
MELITMSNVQIIKKDIKNITLKVKPSCEVILTVPLNTDNRHILYILEKRKDWIDKKVDFFKSYNKIENKEYVSGESFYYKGKAYRLKIIQSDNEKVKLLRGYIQIFIKDKTDKAKKEKMLNVWYMKKSKEYFNQILNQYLPIVKKDIKSIKIRKMKTRWGSCNPKKGYINLNFDLIKKPKECVEYVIFHELVHLVHPNHSNKFYNFLYTYMPDWKKRKDKLEYK